MRRPPIPLALAAAIAVFAASQPALSHDRLPRALAALSPADFARQVSIATDPLDGAIVLSTREGYTRSRALGGARANDVHLRARVDPVSGKITWQVWHDLVYVGGVRDVNAVHYRSAGGARVARPTRIEHWLDRCPPTDAVGFCNQATRIAFELPEHTVREIAGMWRAGARDPWVLRLRDSRGREVTGSLAPAEAAGLVQALEQWRGHTS